ncbi:MAG: right-handed parallel beta-helix repeat-containing protein, partial [Bacteroidetes bacterium]|nr:right-handed parallel beta-helix repeat-containing protein [Bacteroidota bacterium]
DVNRPGTKNLRRIYLNGVSVELMAQHTDGSIEVKVRFDDVDVKNDARWCADEIQLNPVATSTGYSLNVTAGNTITLDRGTTATRRNNPETYNGQQVFNSATLMRCPANTWLNLAPGGGFVVDNGSTLRLESGSRMDIGNGAVLRVKRGGKLELMGGSVLNVLPGGQVIIEEDAPNGNDGHLLFHPNARINMEASNSVLEIAGMLDIQDNATFTTSRSGDPNTTYGLLKFTNTDQPSYNVTAGTNTRFILKSTNSNNRILHVQQESLYGPSTLVEFSLLTGKATLADNARIVPPVTNAATVKFINATVTSNTGLRNTHRGVRLNGQALLTLSNSTFSKGNYGVYSYNSTLGNSPVPEYCSFIDCNTGMYNYDKGIKAISCKFDKCTDGLVCVQMAHTSYLNDCSAQKNAQTGVSFQGSSTLNVTNPAFNYNTIGLSIGGATAVVACGSVSLNKRCGFLVHHGGTLRMDDNHTGHDPVTAVKNGTSILCQQANNVYLDLGLNSLKPMVTGAQNSLFGTFLCQPYSITQPARKNNWNGTVGTPLTSADYSITTCGAPLQFVDPASTPEYTCGQIPLSVPAGSSELAGPPVPGLMDNCSGCAAVMSADSVLMPLNQASLDALELGYNDSLPNNELLAIGAFHALLANPVAAPNYYEKFLLAYDHGLMVESFGDALKKGQLNPTTDNAGMATHLGWMTAVEDARMDAAQPGEQDDFIFYTSLERAQLTRAAGQLDDAVAQLEGIAQPPAPDEQELLARILCYTQTERSLANGTCTWDDVEGIMLACTGQGGTKILMQTPASGPEDSSMAQPGLQPNPATTEVLVRGFGDEECLLRLMDITGRVVIQEVRFTGKTRLPLADVQPGTYVCLITTSKGHLWQGKLVVGR